jgi:hypothetical protein
MNDQYKKDRLFIFGALLILISFQRALLKDISFDYVDMDWGAAFLYLVGAVYMVGWVIKTWKD